jgi:hypothetical protein
MNFQTKTLALLSILSFCAFAGERRLILPANWGQQPAAPAPPRSTTRVST